MITASTVMHYDGSTRSLSNSYPALGKTIQIRLRAAPDASVQHALLRTVPDGEQH